MGELLDAIKAEASKRPKSNRLDDSLREHLGEPGWKDLVKAFEDPAITTSAIHRVIKAKGFACSYSAISRIRSTVAPS